MHRLLLPASLPLRLAIARSTLLGRHAIEQFFRPPSETGIRRRAGGRGRAGRSGEASVEYTREHEHGYEDSHGRSTTPRENKPSAGKIRIGRASEGARIGRRHSVVVGMRRCVGPSRGIPAKRTKERRRERGREREREGEGEGERERDRERETERDGKTPADETPRREGRARRTQTLPFDRELRLTSDLISKTSFQMLRFCVCIQDANATAQRRHIAGRDRLARGGRSKCRFWLLNGEDERRERGREKILTVNVECRIESTADTR